MNHSSLPDKTYIVTLAHRDSDEIEELEFTSPGDALAAYSILATPDNADIYRGVSLYEIDWRGRGDTPLRSCALSNQPA